MKGTSKQQAYGHGYDKRATGRPEQFRATAAEAVVLGAILTVNGSLAVAQNFLRDADFSFLPHRHIYHDIGVRAADGLPYTEDVLAGSLAAYGLGKEQALEHLSRAQMAAFDIQVAEQIEPFCREMLDYSIRFAQYEIAQWGGGSVNQDADTDEITAEIAQRLTLIDDIKRRRKGEPAARFAAPQWAHDLLRKEIAPARWAVPDLFAEGLTLFGGKSKHGKSTMILHLLSAIALGGKALSKCDVEQGTALYLALEDNERRMQERLQRQLDVDLDDPKHPCVPDRLAIYYQWPRFDAGGIDALDAWMDAHADTRMIVIDTYKQVKPQQRQQNMQLYDADYEALLPIQEWANRRHVAVVVVMHLRKAPSEHDPFDEISGSTGIQGVSDNMVVLRKFNGEFTLHRRGRDYLDDDPWLLHGDAETLLWRVETDPMQEANLTGERAALYALLNKFPGGLSPKEISDKLGKSRASVRMMLHRAMQQARGNLRLKNGRYSLERVTPVTESYSVTPVTESYRGESVTQESYSVTGGVTGLKSDVMPDEYPFSTPVTPVTHVVRPTDCPHPSHAIKTLVSGRTVCGHCGTEVR